MINDGKKRFDYDNTKELQQKFEEFVEIEKKTRPWFESFKICVIYWVFGCLWILLSDEVLSQLVTDMNLYEQISNYKGWFFVIVTGVIFFFIIKKSLDLFKGAIDQVVKSYAELSSVNEELIAMNEELDTQNDELEKKSQELYISDERYKLAMEGSSNGIWDLNLITGEYITSEKWRESLGFSLMDKLDRVEEWKCFYHPEDILKVEEAMESYLSGKQDVYEVSYRIKNYRGEYRWILSRGKAVFDSDEKPYRIAGSHTDITEQKLLQRSLMIEKELSERVIFDAPMLVIIMDKEEKIIQFNPYAQNITEFSEIEAIGKNASELLGVDRMMGDKMFSSVLRGALLENNELEITTKGKKKITVLWNNALLHDEKGDVKGIVSIGMNISERRKMESQLHELAYFDRLTKVPNRTSFEENVTNKLSELKSQNRKAALFYIDADDFKHINDTLGHETGDRYIVHLSKILGAEVKKNEYFARLSGDEFAMFFYDFSSREEIIQKAESLLEKIREPWIQEDQIFYLTVSIGIGIFPEHGLNYGNLFQSADTALFHRKDNGKDGYTVYQEEMYEKTLSYIQMNNQIRKAIEDDEFVLAYQPQFDLTNEKVIGAEALIRWNHPERGIVSPMEFIPFAEKTGYITKIDEWVIRSACKQKKRWENMGLEAPKIAVNISGQMAADKTLGTKLANILQEFQMQGDEIEIEVTETSVIEELDQAISVLNEVKKLGVKIALDDFGTGYSSLTYLQKLPIDVLKIDREFIRNVISEDEDVFIFKAIVDLSHNLGLKVIAEGVETKEQKAFLINNVCDYGQGYYLSLPMTVFEMEKFLEQKVK